MHLVLFGMQNMALRPYWQPLIGCAFQECRPSAALVVPERIDCVLIVSVMAAEAWRFCLSVQDYRPGMLREDTEEQQSSRRRQRRGADDRPGDNGPRGLGEAAFSATAGLSGLLALCPSAYAVHAPAASRLPLIFQAVYALCVPMRSVCQSALSVYALCAPAASPACLLLPLGLPPSCFLCI
jgi:hypothetical protein